MIHISVLGSGSSGNAALISAGGTRILVDAGLSARQLCLRLSQIGTPPDTIDAILITHEHGDHISGLDVFCKSHPVPVFCTRMTQETLKGSLKFPKRWNLFEPGTTFPLGPLSITGFHVPHDAVDPVGFTFEDSDSRLGLVSDIGHVTHAVTSRLAGCHTLFIEANYDEAMLADDTRRPWSTKQRIASRHGHLSNSQSAAVAVTLAASGPLHRVILGHLSSDCNNPARAKETVGKALHDAGHQHVHVLCASQDSPTQPLPAAAPPPPPPTPKPPAPPPRPPRRLSDYVQADLF